MPDLSIEEKYTGIICGIDEVGRGPWAGPVVAAAVILGKGFPDGMDDSKKIKEPKREILFDQISATCAVGVGIVEAKVIDDINILNATKLAMQKAFEALPDKPDVALVDGNQPPELPCQIEAVIKGDSKSLSIAAASIIAKVTRDRIMAELANDHPAYAWESNKGYGTKAHQEGLASSGATEHHRRSFAPIRKLLEA